MYNVELFMNVARAEKERMDAHVHNTAAFAT